MTTTELSPAGQRNQAKNLKRVGEAREWLAEQGPLPTAADLVRPIIEALLPLHDLRERVEEHVVILERHEFVALAADEWRAASDLLALHHEVGDLIALELSGWTTMEGHRRRLGAAMRAVLYEAMDTDELVYGCRHVQLDAMR